MYVYHFEYDDPYRDGNIEIISTHCLTMDEYRSYLNNGGTWKYYSITQLNIAELDHLNNLGWI